MRKLLLLVLLSAPVSMAAQTSFDVVEASIAEIQQALAAGTLSSVQLVELYLARIEAYDRRGPALNSIVRVNPDALAIAEALDRERERSGARSALHGIPILVKDNYSTTTMPTTNGSVALADFRPNANATQIDKLLDAGAILLAKTNLHEYAYGITTVGSLIGQTRNPYDIRRVPGGSSGGTGAAVAASFGAIGLGSDTCGSIRIPAAFNNLIGLRPSKGLSSIHGVVPLAHTQDVAGPLARTAGDLAILLDIVAGYDPNDAATEVMLSRSPPAFQSGLRGRELGGLRFGRLANFMDAAGNETRRVVDEALDWYREQGVEIVEIEMPELDTLTAAARLIDMEFRIDLDAYLAQFGSAGVSSLDDVIELGLYHEAVEGVLTRGRDLEHDAEEYARAMAAREELRRAVEALFRSHDLDAIAYPPIARTPVLIGDPQPGNHCTIAAYSGLPALSMPVGFSDDGLPVGMELLGLAFDDADLLALAFPYEQANNPRRTPAVTPPLLNGVAPPPQVVALTFDEQGVRLDGRFEYDAVSNLLRYEMAVAATSTAVVHAVVLVIDRGQGAGPNGPVVHNLLGPEQTQTAGEYFMSPPFRAAFAAGRVYIKVFGASLPATGASRRLSSP